MTHFNFYHPVEVRYGDLDPQGHVNNAKHLTYFEQARIAYMVELGLTPGSAGKIRKARKESRKLKFANL